MSEISRQLQAGMASERYGITVSLLPPNIGIIEKKRARMNPPPQQVKQILDKIEAQGYRVSVFHNPGSLLNTIPAHVEIHAVDLSTDPPQFHMMRVFNHEHADAELECARRIAEAVWRDP